MSEIIIYHNPQCSKSRQTLELLREKGVEPTIVEYLKEVPSKETLQKLLFQLGMTPNDILRSNEQIYKELKEKHGEPDGETLLDWMIQYPKLIQRPIVVHGNKAVIGRPPENVEKLI